MEKGSKGGSLTEGLSEQMACSQKQPRESGQGERPKKGSGTTINGGSGSKKDSDGDYDNSM